MRLITNEELFSINGGDAAATRPPGTNSWGETPEQARAREDQENEAALDALIDRLMNK